jgi:ABC-2 type transport system ATP-binding protein
MDDYIVVAKNLTKIFDKKVKAVDNISFKVKRGEIFGFLGPNGAGKTTTINMLNTLVRPTSGEVKMDGQELRHNQTAIRRLIGLVPQEITIDDDLTGMENIVLQTVLYGVPKEEAKKRIDELLKLLKLTDAADRRTDTYSGGMRKRLELAEGLVHYPKVLFLDEPTLGLDVQTRTVMWEYIKRINREQGVTVFLTTHYMEEADSLCDRIAIIDKGKLVAMGTPDELKDKLGGDIIQFKVKDDKRDLCKDLEKLKYVREAKLLKSGEFRIKVEHGERVMPKLFEDTQKMGIKMETVMLIKPTLDQVFLEYTGRSLRDEEIHTGDSLQRMAGMHSMRRARS